MKLRNLIIIGSLAIVEENTGSGTETMKLLLIGTKMGLK
jgi:hypothetical protein